MADSMAGVIADKADKFGGTKKKGNKVDMSHVEISAWVNTDEPVDKESLRRHEKYLQRERKMLSDILKRWSPSIVADKAKKKFASQMKNVDKELKELRRKLK